MGAPSTAVDKKKENESSSSVVNDSNAAVNDKDKSKEITTAKTNDTVGKVSEGMMLSTYSSLVQQYLGVFMIDNATFLAERCVADYPGNAEAIYLLALCYYRSGSPKRCRQVLLNAPSSQTHTMPNNNNVGSGSIPPASRYLCARCCYDLKEYSRAEEVLLRDCRLKYQQQQRLSAGSRSGSSFPSMDEWILQTTPCPLPNGAAGLALLGQICRKSNRSERAIVYFQMSLQLDPFLWTSIGALAELGSKPLNGFTSIDVPIVAPASMGEGGTPLQQYQPQLSAPMLMTPAANANRTLAFDLSTAGKEQSSLLHDSSVLPTTENAGDIRGGGLRIDTPGLTPIPVNQSNMMMHEEANASTMMSTPTSFGHGENAMSRSTVSSPPVLPPQVLRRGRDVAQRHYYPPSPETPLTHVTRSMRYLKGLGTGSSAFDDKKGNSLALRSDNCQQSNSNSGLPGTTRSLFASSSSENQGLSLSTGGVNQADDPPSALEKPEKEDASSTDCNSAVQEILGLLSVLGAAYQRVCKYQCKEALQILRRLPVRQQMTGWVLHQQGRAFLELNDFNSARRQLELMMSKDPGRVHGLELLSTVYWQLKKEVELAYLSQHVVALDHLAPEAWCVVGNCFSLQKDHESALVFFKRSLQLDGDFTYTHTLSGYEYMANEDFETAIACFRQALRVDDRHYNAWYGLGAIYHRQEKFDLAEYHFGKAVSINPNSSVLRCNLGIAQHANRKSYHALETLAEAFRLDPRNPQARFQRANIYCALNRPEEALAELQKVRDSAPREAAIHFSMGKVLKRLARQEEAMRCFLTAMDLDPKDNQMIKSAMDKLDQPDIDEEAMAAF